MSKFATFTRLSVLTLAASVALYSGACSGDGDSPEPGGQPTDVDLEGVVYLGAANDEGLIVLLDATAKRSPAPVITSPDAGATLTERMTFSYHAGESASLHLTLPHDPTPAARNISAELAQLLGAERAVYAHGAPMNGAGYLLTFATADDPKVLRVFTDQTTYLPDDAEWQALVDATDELTLTVRLAVFDEGRLAAGGGPFESAPLAFSIVVP